jgi:myosin protein heavy chain
MSPPASNGHARPQSFAELGFGTLERGISRRGSLRPPAPGTFAPKFIKAEGLDGAEEKVGGIEGENDFSGKRYVWVKDAEQAFVRGWVVEDLIDGQLRVQCDDGSVRLAVL